MTVTFVEEKANEMYAPTRAIKAALRYLTGNCDGARKRDGQGFNSADTVFGHSLAQSLFTRGGLTKKQYVSALRMLRKYAGQLEIADIFLPTTAEMKAVVPPHKLHPDLGPVYRPIPTKLVEIKTVGKYMGLFFSYSPELLERARNLTERRFIKRAKLSYWRVPVSCMEELVAAFPEAIIEPELAERYAQLKELAAISTASDSDFQVPGMKRELYGFQRAGAKFLEISQGRALVADQMGLGKTIQSLAYLQMHPELRPVLIIVPATVKLNWKREIEMSITDRAETYIINGRTPRELPRADIYITNYASLTNQRAKDATEEPPHWVDALLDLGPKILICDEAHLAKNAFGKSASNRGKAVVKLTEQIPHTILLTGTPIMNRPKELYPLLRMIDPKSWPDMWAFKRRYCGMIDTGYGFDDKGSSNLDELHGRIKPYVLRRTKSQVLVDLPPKQRAFLPMPLASKSAYLKKVYECQERIRAARRFGGASGQHLKAIEELKQAAAQGKLPAAIAWMKDFLDTGEKLVVFATHKFVIAELMRVFEKVAVKIDGSTSQKKRQAAVDSFQNNENVLLFIGNIKAAGLGITLTAASNVAFLELDWTPAAHAQAEDRCIVEGQLVTTETGIKPIEQVVVGDNVLTHEGRFMPVTDTHNRQAREDCITTIDFFGYYEPLRCTHDHLVYVLRDNWIKWIPASQIMPRDFLVSPVIQSQKHIQGIAFPPEHRIYSLDELEAAKNCTSNGCSKKPIARGMCDHHYRLWMKAHPIGFRPPLTPMPNGRHVAMPEEIELDDAFLFFMGWYIAEGFSSVIPGKGKFVSCAAHKNKRLHLKYIANRLDKLGLNSTIYDKANCNGIEMRAYSSEMANWFYAEFGHQAVNKHIPAWIMNLSPHQIAPFLQGYFMGDGYYRDRTQEWTSASIDLAHQISALTAKLGFCPNIRKVIHPVEGGIVWVGSYQMNGNQTRGSNDGMYVYKYVRSVSTRVPKRGTRVYDLTVAGDHSMVVSNVIVHNCHRIGQDDSVTCYYLLAQDTIDEDISALLEAKRIVVERVIDGEEHDLDFGMMKSLVANIMKGAKEDDTDADATPTDTSREPLHSQRECADPDCSA